MAPRMPHAARVIAAFLSLSSVVAAAQTTLPRQVAAPAADILSGVVRLPAPGDAPMRSRAAIQPVEFAWSADATWRSQLRVPVEGAGPLALALASPDAASWRVSVDLGGGVFAPLESAPGLGRVEHRAQVLESDLPGWVVERFDFERAVPGWWTSRALAPREQPLP